MVRKISAEVYYVVLVSVLEHVEYHFTHPSLCAIQLTGLTDMDQLNLADDTDQQNANDEPESHLVAQPPRKRGLLRKLSSAFQRKPMTRYDSFDGHRDSLDIVHHQIKEGNIAYRPRVPYPSSSDNSVDNEKSSNSKDNIAEVAFQHPADVSQTQPAGESTKGKRQEDKEAEREELRISDIASQQDARADIVSVPQRLLHVVREDEGHQKISADTNSTPLPPQLQNDKVGFARSA